MAMFHTLVLIGAAAEVVFLHRPFIPALAIPMLALFIFSNIVRWWVIRTLGEHWNVQVMDSTKLGVITTGPFRYVRHPNYAAVFVEMIALPLIHTAWITALAGAIAHVGVLALRLATEERVLFANPDYAAAMSSKPRFIPGLF
jgi:methyltransferase